MKTSEINRLLEIAEATTHILSDNISGNGVFYATKKKDEKLNKTYRSKLNPLVVYTILTELKSALERERELQKELCSTLSKCSEEIADVFITKEDEAKSRGWTCFEKD